jgi:hypothetical protein
MSIIYTLHVLVEGITEYTVGFTNKRRLDSEIRFLKADMTGMNYKLTVTTEEVVA